MWQEEIKKISKLLRFVDGAKTNDLAILLNFLQTPRMSKTLRKQISDLYQSHKDNQILFLKIWVSAIRN